MQSLQSTKGLLYRWVLQTLGLKMRCSLIQMRQILMMERTVKAPYLNLSRLPPCSETAQIDFTSCIVQRSPWSHAKLQCTVNGRSPWIHVHRSSHNMQKNSGYLRSSCASSRGARPQHRDLPFWHQDMPLNLCTYVSCRTSSNYKHT